jgi:menaquinone-dependent protoporphyrinogen oxidase
MSSVLVAYDSRNGSTAEVAAAIAHQLGQRGFSVTVLQAREVRDPSGFDAVVIGAPLYNGRWLSGAHRLLKRLAKSSAGSTPALAIFALGPRVDEGPQNWEGPLKQFEHALSKHPDTAPLTTALFGGADPPRKSPRRDVRDWGRIANWADEVAGLLS